MGKSSKIAAVIVVYNKQIKDSVTCSAIEMINKSGADVFVVDNSTEEYGNNEYCHSCNIKYISMNGNKGLSRAYNAAINECIKAYDTLVLMDDDTNVPDDYFDTLEIAMEEHPDIDIFAPIVYGQDGVIYSPNEFDFLRNHFIRDRNQEISPAAFNAIASMLAVRMRVFDEYRFNERLFVDQVDQNFCYDQRIRGRKFMKLNCIVHQNFYQRGATLSPKAGWNRLKLRIVDVVQQADLMGGWKWYFFALVKCSGLGFQIGIKSKSIEIPFKAMLLAIRTLCNLERAS